MSITLIGDVHGFTKTYEKWLRNNLDPQARSIQLGDMGLGFAGRHLSKLEEGHKFFRGNHDSPSICREHPNYLGDYGYLAADGVFWLAGAFSIDRIYRTEGISWWRDEELSYEELQKAIDLYTQVRPRFVISHEAPSKAVKVMLYDLMAGSGYFTEKLECSKSRTAEAMQMMLDISQPERWCFGHYHVDKEFLVPGYETKFRCIGGIMSSGEQPHTYQLETK